MEKRVITALFDDYESATDAVRRLKQAGVPDSDISLIGRNDRMTSGTTSTSSTTSGAADDTSNTGTGATAGAVIGGGAGLLAGIGALAIPGLGPVVAAGWLASTLLGATAGAATGGIIGALTEWGMSEEEAHAYSEGVRRGGTVVTARVDDTMMNVAMDILDDEGTVDIKERSTAWRNEGWSGRYEPASTMQSTATTSGSVPPAGAVPPAGSPGIGRDVRPTDVEVTDTRDQASRSASDVPRRKA